MPRAISDCLGVEGTEELLASRDLLLRRLPLGLAVGLALEVALLLAGSSSDHRCGVRVQAEESSTVAQRVLLLRVWALRLRWASRSNDALDFVRVDDAGNISVGDLADWELEALLDEGNLVSSAEDRVELLESGLAEDDESTEVSSRGELEEVQAVDRGDLNTGQVAESLDNSVVLVVDNERTTSLNVAAVAELALTSSDLARVGDLDNVVVSLDGLEEGNSLLGLGQVLDRVLNDERNLLNLLDAVTSGKQERRDGSGGQSRGDGVSLLLLVGLDEPSSPQTSGGEHVTTSGHVTEGGLAGSVCSTTANSWDTGDGTTGTPGLGRGLVTSVAGDGVGLSLVLGDVLCKR